MKKLNEPLETLYAIVMIHNANEHIHKNTWLDAERVILEHKDELQEPVNKKEVMQGFTNKESNNG